MPVQTSKSSLFKKLGSQGVKAIKAHAHDDPKYGRVDLPPNIRNGVAKLTKLYFDTYKNGDNKGELFLRGEAAVVFPKEAATENGPMYIYGATTSPMPWPCCETKKSLDENMETMLSQLKLLGADKDELDAAAEEEGGIEAIAAAIEEAAPYFRFTTDPKYDQNDKKKEKVIGTWENWRGIKGPGYDLTDYTEESDDQVDDETGGKGAKADVEEDEKPAKNGKLTAKKKEKEPEPEAADAEVDLDALAEVADDDDNEDSTDAKKQLKGIALEAGLSKKWVDDVAKNWTAVAERVKEKQDEASQADQSNGEAEGEAAADDEPKEPTEGDIVKYKGAKDKKATEYEVTAVDAKKKTVNLKQIDDGKSKYLGVKFDDVEIVE
jgi:hypothetical protein